MFYILLSNVFYCLTFTYFCWDQGKGLINSLGDSLLWDFVCILQQLKSFPWKFKADESRLMQVLNYNKTMYQQMFFDEHNIRIVFEAHKIRDLKVNV